MQSMFTQQQHLANMSLPISMLIQEAIYEWTLNTRVEETIVLLIYVYCLADTTSKISMLTS